MLTKEFRAELAKPVFLVHIPAVLNIVLLLL